ncbi:MAG: peptidoglycan-binding protein [Oscillospiraceae bacterium]|nr:peptidoglycan-binding protein [Oscillospiraceae bacterium]
MGTGYITVNVFTGEGAKPIESARVVIMRPDGQLLYETYTNANGLTEPFALTCPDKRYSLDPNSPRVPYSVCDVVVTAEGFLKERIHGVQVFDTQTTILPVYMHPLSAEPGAETEEDIFIPPPAILNPQPWHQEGPENGMPGAGFGRAGGAIPVFLPYDWDGAARNVQQTEISPAYAREVFIPDYITVHLGVPTNTSARNIRVRFPDYIKNVASSEIYATWPHNSLVANIHAIVTFALNRVYTEWYRIQGYNFDITNSTSFDMAYREGGPIFESISRIVDDVFNVYAHRIGFRDPFFTQFCDGNRVQCPGLSQWGTVTLANRGMSPLEILRYYYPRDLILSRTNNIRGITSSFPGTALRLGSRGEDVRRMQNYLNRLRVNFPLIPRINNPNGIFDEETQQAVRVFQRTFNMAQDGVIGPNTWNRISYIYVSVTRLAELDSEGHRVDIGENPPDVTLSQGSRGPNVNLLQFMLNMISAYFDSVPPVIKDSVFDSVTRDSVREFQRTFGLTTDGVVGPTTWAKLYDVYRGIQGNVPVPPDQTVPPHPPGASPPFPGVLRVGSTGENVRLMQQYLNTIRNTYPSIPRIAVDGVFGEETRRAVTAFQQTFSLLVDGVIGPITWAKIIEQYLIASGGTGTGTFPPTPSPGPPFPGTLLRNGSRGDDVRLMQSKLMQLRGRHPSIPFIAVDGIFGPRTQEAVIAFQRAAGLNADGIIGPITWGEIIRQAGELG